jgi:hypothetical protein
MTDERIKDLLRLALPPPAERSAVGDLWPAVLNRFRQPPAWSWLDLGLAAGVAIVLLMFPKAFLLLAYHM